MKFGAVRLGFCLLLCLVFRAVPALADDADPKMMAQLAEIKKNCELAQAKAKEKEQQLEATSAAADLPPQKRQEVEQKIAVLKAVIAKTDTFLAKPLPSTEEERETYLTTAFQAIADVRVNESSVAKELGVDPESRVDAALSKFAGNAADLETRYGRWDGQHTVDDAALTAPVVQGPNTHFFGAAGQLPPSAIQSAPISAAYTPTTVEEATKQTDQDGGVGGGIMLEGVADGLDPVSSVDYDPGVNALLLNGDLVYFVKIPPWSLATMCREIGTDRRGLLGVSETGADGLVFGDNPDIYKGSDLAYELMIADKFLGDLVFAKPNAWTTGYKFPGAPPTRANFKGEMLVRFAFGNFRFAVDDGQVSVVSSSLEVRMMPFSKASTPTGQMLPDYNAIDKGWTPPDAYLANARILTDHIDYFRREALITQVFADGETAAILRWLKQSGQDLNALADTIETGEAE